MEGLTFSDLWVVGGLGGGGGAREGEGEGTVVGILNKNN